MNVNDAVARILKLEGIEWISCFPSNLLIEAVANEGIRTIMFRHERGAIMAADGFSRMNDREKFGVVITQGGPGSENSMGGIAQAFGDNIPILYLAGGPALNQYAVRPNFSPVRTYQTVSKYGEVIVQADHVASVMRRVFHNLRNGRPGPVLVEIPADVGGHEVPEEALNYNPPKRSPQAPAKSDIQDAVKLLLNANKPVIWSGMGVLLSGATAELKELDEKLYRFFFPERPGALLGFLNEMGQRWNISLFHYRNHGSAYGRVLMGFQVKANGDAEFREFLENANFPYVDETNNPVYEVFLK